LILGILVIPYFLAFSWIDDKRKLFVKDETMYPELNYVQNVEEIQVKEQNIEDMEFDKKENAADAVFEIVSLPQVQRIESRQLMEYDDVTDNKKMNVENTREVYEKAGRYIVNMGYVRNLIHLINVSF
jgi:hypothetical protein